MGIKLRRMLGDRDAPCTQSLLSLIDTRSKATICRWCIDFAEAAILRLFEKRRPDDSRPRDALSAARLYLDGKVKFFEVKNTILYAPFGESVDPVTGAAERALYQAASVVRYPSRWHAIAVYFYGAAAIGYDRLGMEACIEEYNAVAEEVCADMTAALEAIAETGIPNPAD